MRRRTTGPGRGTIRPRSRRGCQSQPQGTRLMFLKNMIWDGMERLVQRLIEDADCDIAIVAYIFWACHPGVHRRQREREGVQGAPGNFAKMDCLSKADRFCKGLRRTSTEASTAAASSHSTGSRCSTACISMRTLSGSDASRGGLPGWSCRDRCWARSSARSPPSHPATRQPTAPGRDRAAARLPGLDKDPGRLPRRPRS